MKATEILSEMGKTKNIIGYAAKLYSRDENQAKDFIFECNEQIQVNPQKFITHFGVKTHNDIKLFVSDNGNSVLIDPT